MTGEPRLVLADDVTVIANGLHLARCVIEPTPAFESPRPYWHPLRTLHGAVVSDHRPPDHSWHWGLSLAVANIRVNALDEEVNLWGGVTWVTGDGYRQLNNNGSERHDGWRTSAGGATEDLTWCTAGGQEFLAETRAHRLVAVRTGWALRVTSTWRNLTDDVIVFGSPTTAGRPNAGYGGFFLRGSEALRGARVELDGSPIDADAAMGERGMAMSLLAPGGLRVTMRSLPGNPVEPTPWFVRTDPVVMLCAAPFFHTQWTLSAGQQVTWVWELQIED
ncbi:DUF6807 family protein [Raineyella sp. LH-20]|uniref:DUF6807 family protein n=1 Tax=Raineyella sp. LH-20 TaxID=3081204 RepID=UPI0029535D06|nr:DUF6807 family protein [Raineyella sp. LH-20]WOP19320.1 DUF6807 family protein [Raineyella sp. LH-20]